MDGIQKWINQNLSWMIGVSAATLVAWGSLNARVNIMAQEHQNLDGRLIQIQDLTERIVKLEEGRDTNADNINEIKDDIKIINEDIKDIKRHFEIK